MAHTSVYDQLKRYQTIPNAWEDWADYRFEMTNWIIKETLAGTTALIIGAGACNDYDLVMLAKHFSHIALFDFDEEEMKTAVKMQFCNNEPADNISYISGTVTGINECDYRRFADILQAAVNLNGSETDIVSLSSLACKIMDEAFDARTSYKYPFSENSFDYCLAFGVHSQLNSIYPQIWEAFMTALKSSDFSVHMKARELNSVLAKEVNSVLLTVSVNGVLFGIEDTRLGVGGAVEGACQATADLNERIKSMSVDLISHQHALWPFTLDSEDSKIYIMNWLHIKKR